MNGNWRLILTHALLGAVLLPASAIADPDTAMDLVPTTQSEPALASFGPVLDEQALAAHRGGQQDAFFNDMRSRATISQTSTTNVGTGTNAIADGAFTNSNGFPTVIQNTGNNVIIQNSTILNLRLQ